MAAGTVVVLLVLGEAAVRLVELRGASEEYRWEAASRWRSLHRLVEGGEVLYELAPGASATIDYGRRGRVTYRISSQGVRGPERAIPKPAGVRRILILGDSVTFGYYVPEDSTFVSLLERALRRLDPSIEVVNGGVGGYNTHNELVWLAQRGLAFEPDVVVLAFCPNDVDNPYFHFSWHTLDRLGPLPPALLPDPSMARELPPPSGAWHEVKKRFRLAALLASRWALLRTNLAVSAAAAEGASGTKALSRLPYGDCLAALCDEGSPRRAWLRTHLAMLDSLRASHGFDVVVVYLPLSYQARGGPGLCARDALETLALESGFLFVDPLEAPAPSGRLHYDPTHLTPAGHRWVARAVETAVRRVLSTGSPKH